MGRRAVRTVLDRAYVESLWGPLGASLKALDGWARDNNMGIVLGYYDVVDDPSKIVVEFVPNSQVYIAGDSTIPETQNPATHDESQG